jgi:hypothetical protein
MGGGRTLRAEGCQDCDGLWERYKTSVLEHTRLTSKLRLAQLSYEQEVHDLQAKLRDAEQERDEIRRLIIEHERTTHPGTKLSFSE